MSLFHSVPFRSVPQNANIHTKFSDRLFLIAHFPAGEGTPGTTIGGGGEWLYFEVRTIHDIVVLPVVVFRGGGVEWRGKDHTLTVTSDKNGI